MVRERSSISCCVWSVVDRNSASVFWMCVMRWSLMFMILLAETGLSVRRCEAGKRFPANRKFMKILSSGRHVLLFYALPPDAP